MSMQEKALGVVVASMAGFFTNEASKQFIGVDLSTVVGAVLGATAAVAWDETKRAHGRTYALAFATVVTACLLTGFLPKFLGWEWTSKEGAEASVAGIGAVVLYFFMPEAGKKIGTMVRNFKLSDVLPRRRRNQDDDYP